MKFNAGQFKKGNVPLNPIKKGEHRGLVTEFKKGHKLSPDALRKKSEAIMDHQVSSETRDKISESRIERHKKLGYLNSPATREKISEALKKNPVKYWLGKKRSKETIEKIKKSRIGKYIGEDSSSWKGGPQEITCEICGEKKLVKYNARNTARFCTNKCRGVWVGNQYRGRKLTPDQIKNALRRRIPTRLEEAFSAIVQKHNLPYDYVGNGAFVIENCNPDFINTNDEKIAIEVYAKFYKQLDGRTVKAWKKKRNAIFKKYGWKVIYFEASEVNEKKVLEVLSWQ